MGNHNSRASASESSVPLIRAPTAMEFHPRRYHINLRRINALTGCSRPLSTRFCVLSVASLNTLSLSLGQRARVCRGQLFCRRQPHVARSPFRSIGRDEDEHALPRESSARGCQEPTRERDVCVEIFARIDTAGIEVEYRLRRIHRFQAMGGGEMGQSFTVAFVIGVPPPLPLPRLRVYGA